MAGKIVSSISPGPVMGEKVSTSSISSSSSSSIISPLRRPATLALRLWLPALVWPAPPDGLGEDVFNMGPLKTFFLRLAKTNPPVLFPRFPHGASLKVEIGGWRTTRMLEGKADVVGVAGRTLTEWWGERVGRDTLDIEPEPLEEVEEALE
jgi:hypothetical protein